MSAEAIMLYAKTQGWCVKVETHGQMGADNLITAEEVAAADLVFAATDIEIDLSKFEGKPLYRTSTHATLKTLRKSLIKHSCKRLLIRIRSKKRLKMLVVQQAQPANVVS